MNPRNRNSFKEGIRVNPDVTKKKAGRRIHKNSEREGQEKETVNRSNYKSAPVKKGDSEGLKKKGRKKRGNK